MATSPRASPTERIVHAVADRVGRDPLELPPLYHAVDPDALNALVETLDRGSVTFEYVDEIVTVHSDGTVDVSDAVPTASPRAQD